MLNAAGILLGGVLGLTMSRKLPPASQIALKGLLGVFTVYVGLRLTRGSLAGSLGMIAKQLAIVLLSLILGRISGRLMRLQKFLNRLGQHAKENLARAGSRTPKRFADGFITCSLLSCSAPLSFLGATLDGLQGHWQTLGLKAVIDALAIMAFVSTFGSIAILSVVPVVAYQGTITLVTSLLAPFLSDHLLLNSVNATAGLLGFCIALIILELKRIELADYLPRLIFAPLITWVWR